MCIACRDDFSEAISNANNLLYQKKYIESEHVFRKVFNKLNDKQNLNEEQEKKELYVLDRLGKINYLYLNDYSRVIKYYKKLIHKYKKSKEAFHAYITIADIYQYKSGDIQKAIDIFNILIKEFPDHPGINQIYLEIIKSYFKLKNYYQVRFEATELIKLKPNSKEAKQAQFQIANSYYLQDRFTEALAIYKKIILSDSNESLKALAFFEAGNCLQEFNSMEKALNYYYESLHHHPNPYIVQKKIRKVRERIYAFKPSHLR